MRSAASHPGFLAVAQNRLKILQGLNFLANRYQFLFLGRHQANSVEERLGPLLDLPDIVGVGANLLANND